MKTFRLSTFLMLSTLLIFSACSSLNKTQKGAAVGTAAGSAAGAIVGKASGNTALGAIVGAAVGGTAGAVIGRQMDKQAEEIQKTVPDARVERVGEGIVVEFSSEILFGFDQSNLSSEAKNNLDKLVVVLNNYQDTDIEVQGHTDSTGPEAYNQQLSEQRASAVSAYLTQKGITNERIALIGFGELYPKYSNDTEAGRAQNRRVDFLITANEKMQEAAKNEAGS